MSKIQKGIFQINKSKVAGKSKDFWAPRSKILKNMLKRNTLDKKIDRKCIEQFLKICFKNKKLYFIVVIEDQYRHK